MATKLADAYIQIIPSAQGIKGSIASELNGEANSAGASAGASIASKIKGAIAAAGIGAAIASTVKSALDEGGKLQQSFGGLDTLYGDAAEAAKEYAYMAAQAGISANDYAEQAVSFGAGLKQAFGGDSQKAVEAANTAIMDMADNAAKMGTPIENIQNAYQGFAKSNYTMLDNLKLGYGGTKTEMERLLADAEKFSGVKYDINNLGDVYDAIHVVQSELGLAGVAAEEAQGTLTGSFASMKAAASNLLADMALGESVGPDLVALANNTKNFLFGNFLPMVGNVFKSVPQLVKTGFLLAKDAITSIDWIGAAHDLIGKIRTGLQNLATDIPTKLQEIGQAAVDWFKNINWSQVGQDVIGLLKDGAQLLFHDIPQLLLDIGNAAFDWFVSVDWLGVGQKAIELIGQGISFLVSNIPTAIKAIATNAINLFTQSKWLQAGLDIIKFIGNGIASVVLSIPQKIKDIAETAINKFKAVNWRAAGGAVIKFIVNGFVDLVTSIPNKLKEIGESAVLKLKSVNWRAAGKAVIDFVVNGIKDLATSIPNKLKDIGKNAINAVKGVNWLGLGKDIINGIANGIKSLPGALVGAVKNAAQNALDAAKKFLHINSPSKRFRDEVGAPIAEGIMVGFTGGMKDFESDMVKSLSAAERALAANMALSTNYTVDTPTSQAEMITEALNGILPGIQEIADNVERGIGNMRMVLNNREAGRFISNLGFAR